MQGGKTGIVAVLDSGKVGKTIAFRFDMDANDLDEAQDDKHLPYQEGFASRHEHAMHGCGHDGHVAVGLAVAELLAKHKDELIGKVKLIFQPAEEGVRGAYAMVKAGVVDDVDYFFSGHLGFAACEDDLLVTMTDGFWRLPNGCCLYRCSCSCRCSTGRGEECFVSRGTSCYFLKYYSPS